MDEAQIRNISDPIEYCEKQSLYCGEQHEQQHRSCYRLFVCASEAIDRQCELNANDNPYKAAGWHGVLGTKASIRTHIHRQRSIERIK